MQVRKGSGAWLNPSTNAAVSVDEERTLRQPTGVQALLFTITCFGETLRVCSCLYLINWFENGVERSGCIILQ